MSTTSLFNNPSELISRIRYEMQKKLLNMRSQYMLLFGLAHK